jgi:integrase
MLTIPTRKVSKRLPDALSKSQIRQLLRGAKTPRDLAVLELFYASGVRRAELCALNCEDVHFDADGKGASVNIAHGKGDKQRFVLIGQYAVRALRAYLGARTSGPLFLTRRREQQGSVVFYDTTKSTYWNAVWAEWKRLPNGKWKSSGATRISALTKNCQARKPRGLSYADSSSLNPARSIPDSTLVAKRENSTSTLSAAAGRFSLST